MKEYEISRSVQNEANLYFQGVCSLVQLLAYSFEYQNEIVYKIADFFGFHRSLFESNVVLNDSNFEMAKENINTWTSEGHSFHIIILDDKPVGFLHIGYRGGNVAWIEDIYVDKDKRGQGIASQAIRLAEEVIRQRKDYTAICFDVVPRNYDALKLYYRLGYINMSMITVRKELYENEYDKKINLFDFEFNY